ncbi:MAG: hypothetical protein AAF234_16080 [Pseudomonadota bacterium]
MSVVSSPRRSGPRSDRSSRSYPWSSKADDAVHLPTLARMAAANRILRGESLGERAARCGLTVGQLDMLERGLIVAPGTIIAVLAACGFHRDSFSRKHLGPVLERQDRCAQTSSRDAQRERLQERVGA